jgi:hypothetical protein
MTWTEWIVGGVVAFHAAALLVWIVFLNREITEDKAKKHKIN